MTDEEKQKKMQDFLEQQESEREALVHDGVFTEEQAKAIQLYVSMHFFKR